MPMLLKNKMTERWMVASKEGNLKGRPRNNTRKILLSLSNDDSLVTCQGKGKGRPPGELHIKFFLKWRGSQAGMIQQF